MGAKVYRSRLVPAPAPIAGGERATVRTHDLDHALKPFGVLLRIFFNARVVERRGATATGCGGESISQEAVSYGA